MAATTSAAVTLRDASRSGSIHTRMAKFWPPRICASATPSSVDRRGCTTRTRYSVTCCGVICGLANVRYISAKDWPVPLATIGSSASEGNEARTA